MDKRSFLSKLPATPRSHRRKAKNQATLKRTKPNRKTAHRVNHFEEEPEMSQPPPNVTPTKGKKFDKVDFSAEDFPEYSNSELDTMPSDETLSKGRKSRSFFNGRILGKFSKSSALINHLKTSSMTDVGKLSNGRSTAPMPVIVVTDIGADIDDTLALFVMLGATDAIKVVAVVTSVNNGLHRGAVTRGYLRLLGVEDEEVEILPSVDGCIAGCHLPKTFPSTDEAALGRLENTPKRIIEICKKHQDTGVILIGIASLTPIAKAIDLDVKGERILEKTIKNVYLQGNVNVIPIREGKACVKEATDDPELFTKIPVRLTPNPESYNFKNDMDAAATVFNHLQHKAPFTVLGKYAAYKVPIRKGDFADWSKTIRRTWNISRTRKQVSIPDPPDLLETAKRQMKTFRRKNSKKFDQIYSVPEGLSDEQIAKFKWFDEQSDSYICSHPYDPLLALTMIEDVRRKQEPQRLQVSAPNLGVEQNMKGDIRRHQSLFHKYYCTSSNARITHSILGNISTRHSVPNSSYVHDVLVDHISKGVGYHGKRW